MLGVVEESPLRCQETYRAENLRHLIQAESQPQTFIFYLYSFYTVKNEGKMFWSKYIFNNEACILFHFDNTINKIKFLSIYLQNQ